MPIRSLPPLAQTSDCSYKLAYRTLFFPQLFPFYTPKPRREKNCKKNGGNAKKREKKRSAKSSVKRATVNDPNPAPQKPTVAISTQDQVETLLKDKCFNAQNKAGLAAMKDKITIEDAGNTEVGIPPLKEPFNQVVLVTDNAMKKLKFVEQGDLPSSLAEKQTKLVAFLKKKGYSAIHFGNPCRRTKLKWGGIRVREFAEMTERHQTLAIWGNFPLLETRMGD
ncbi:hypothetical protein C8R44DRAFT_744426 [Mycena epipterygia]|nr:hypothetical protein C8R44DRAFT_744426 [Mycena epipterygia]